MTHFSATLLLALALGLCLAVACSELEVVELPGDPIYLTDMSGRQYDITYAITTLGFDHKRFSASAGPDARQPIINPQFAEPGDRGYPPAEVTTDMIGTRVDGEARAYPLAMIFRAEVVDDVFGDVPIAVAY